MTVTVEDFLQRWLLHVPPPGLQGVRAYGLYAPTKRAVLAQSRQVLGQAPLTVPLTLDWQTSCAQRGEQHPECCPVCGQKLIRTDTLPPQRHLRRPERSPAGEALPGPEFREAA